MKKSFLIVTICLILCLGCSCILMGCGGSGGSQTADPDADEGQKIKKCDIEIYNGATSSSFSIIVGEQASVTAFSKPGCALVGYFDAETEGTKYFGSDGKSVAVWQETNPTVFYARYKSASGLAWASNVIASDPIKSSYTGYTKRGANFSAEFMSAIKGNLDKNVTLTLNFDEITSKTLATTTLTYALGTENEVGAYIKGTLQNTSNAYESKTFTATVPASTLKGAIIVAFADNNYNFQYSIKNIQIMAQFEEFE